MKEVSMANRYRPAAGLAILLGLPLFLAVAPAGAPGEGADERQRLAAGEVLVHLEPVPGDHPREGVGTGVIDAPPERVFAALTDLAHYQEWVPFVERSDAAPQGDGSVVSSQSLRLPALIGDRSYKIRAVAKHLRLRWDHVPGSGNVVDTHGSWSVTAFGPGRTLATCHLYTDPGSVPHWAMNRATEKSLPWIFKGLRQQVLRDRYLKN